MSVSACVSVQESVHESVYERECGLVGIRMSVTA